MKAITKAYLETHISVFLWGFTAVLGKLITLSAFMLVWWRVMITAASLYVIIRLGKELRIRDKKVLLRFASIGIIVGIHWLCFYGAIKYANASIALICMATTALFTAILEPLIMKQKFQWYELLIGIIIIPGMGLIINDTEDSKLIGIGVGILAALLATLFSILNKRYIQEHDPVQISYIEIGSAFLFLTITMPILVYFNPSVQIMPQGTMDWFYIILLALVCTTLPFILSLRALKHISAFASNLIVNLEPIYGIALALILLNEYEELGTNFYLGSLTILTAVLLYPSIKRKFESKPSL